MVGGVHEAGKIEGIWGRECGGCSVQRRSNQGYTPRTQKFKVAGQDARGLSMAREKKSSGLEIWE